MIRFVYFDVGGVVIKDFSCSNKWESLWLELGGELGTLDDFSRVWKRYEGEVCVGRDVETLIPVLNHELGLQIPLTYSILDGFITRMAANPSIWPVTMMTKSKCKIGLLTNAYPRMFEKTSTAGLLPPVEWDVVIDSSIVKLKKPDPQIFVLAQKKCGIKPEEILYVENSQMHIEAAKKLGWQTYLYDSGDYEGSSKAIAAYMQKI